MHIYAYISIYIYIYIYIYNFVKNHKCDVYDVYYFS